MPYPPTQCGFPRTCPYHPLPYVCASSRARVPLGVAVSARRGADRECTCRVAVPPAVCACGGCGWWRCRGGPVAATATESGPSRAGGRGVRGHDVAARSAAAPSQKGGSGGAGERACATSARAGERSLGARGPVLPALHSRHAHARR